MIPQIVADGLVTGCIYALMAVGFSVIYTSMHFFNLSHGGILLLGAFLTYFFRVDLHLNLPLAILLGTLAATLLFSLVAATVFMPMRARGSDMWNVAMASLGVFIMTQAVVGIFFGTAPVDITGSELPSVYQFLGVRVSSTELIIVVVAVLSILLYSIFMRATKTGMAARASVNDREMTGLTGANVALLELTIIAVGAGLAALAGGLVAMTGAVSYTLGLNGLLKAIVVSSLGIEAGVIGALLGGLFLGVVENLIVFLSNPGWRDGIALVILMAYIYGIVYVRRTRKNR